jgi:hypothetical protein
VPHTATEESRSGGTRQMNRSQSALGITQITSHRSAVGSQAIMTTRYGNRMRLASD